MTGFNINDLDWTLRNLCVAPCEFDMEKNKKIFIRESYFVVNGVTDLRWFSGREEREIEEALMHPEFRKDSVGFVYERQLFYNQGAFIFRLIHFTMISPS